MKKSVLMIMVVAFTLMVSNLAMAGGRHYRGYYGGGHNGHYYGGRGYGGLAGAALGGLIVGGIIGSSLNNPYYQRRVYVNSYPGSVVTGSTFLLNSNGDCFLITNSSRGSQILSSVPAGNCR